MEINEMNLEDVTKRLAELTEEVRSMESVEDIEKATEEKQKLLERKAELVDLENRTATADALNNGEIIADKVKEQREELKTMNAEVKTYGTETKEYRDAFYAMLAGNATAEQRTILTTPISVDGDGTNDGAAIAIPKTLDDMIWDNIHTAHPILADITTIASGIVMEVTKHTAIAVRVTGKKDAATSAGAEENTFVKVVLAGVDYEKYVELTYAEAKMSQGALEKYLATEIAAELGEALAKDVFARILTDATTSQKVTATSSVFEDVKDALALATQASNPIIYAPSSKYYELVGALDANGNVIDIKRIFGVEIKKDDAATAIVVLDSKMFVLNQISGVTIESDRDVKLHRVVVSGYMRAEGCLRKTKAASYISA